MPKSPVSLRSISTNSARTALTVLPLLLLAACGKGADTKGGAGGPPAMPPPQVSVVTVQAKDAPLTYEYTGQTAGSRETEVRARVSGILQKRLYVEGSTVKAGAALFQIDPANLQTQVASTEANVAVADAKVNQVKRDLARLQPLITEKAISQKEFDDARSAVESAEATAKLVRAQAAEAKLNVGYTRVVAPISGVTGTAAKADGSLVNSTDMLTTIVQVNPMYANFSVSEGDLLKLNKQIASGEVAVPGKQNGSNDFKVTIKLADGSTYPLTGKMTFASEKLNATTGSFDARAEIPNPTGSLRPGQFIRVVLAGANRSQSITVPQRAIIDSPMGKMVFKVMPDDTLAPQPVELDGWSNGDWIVTKGLKAGDRVMADGVIKAHVPGMKVVPVPFVPVAAGMAGAPPAAANTKGGSGAPPAMPADAKATPAAQPAKQ